MCVPNVTSRVPVHTRLGGAEPTCLPVISGDLLRDLDFEVAVGHDPLQATVLHLELPQAFHVHGFELAEPQAPQVDRLLGDAVLLRHLRHRRLVGFTEDVSGDQCLRPHLQWMSGWRSGVPNFFG